MCHSNPRLDSGLVHEDCVLVENISQNSDTVVINNGSNVHPHSQIKTFFECLYVSILVYVHFFISECLITLHITFCLWGEIDVSAGGFAIEVMIACHSQCCLPETAREISHRIQAVPALEITLALLIWCNRFLKKSEKAEL